MNRKFLLIFICFFLLVVTNCKAPTSTDFNRNNPNDPTFATFTLSPPQTFEFEFKSNKSVLISWEDTTNYTDGYILKKSLDGVRFFLLDTVEYPALEYLDESKEITADTRYSLASFRRIETGLNISDSLSLAIDFGSMELVNSSYTSSPSQLELTWEFTSGWPFIVEVVLFAGFDGVTYLDTLRNGETSFTYTFEQDFEDRFLEARAYLLEEELENPADDSYSSRVGAEYYTMDYLPENVQVNVVNENEVKITWEDNSDFEDGYEISRKKSELIQAGGYTIIGELPQNSSSFTDTQSPFSGVPCNDSVKEIRYSVRVTKDDTGTGFSGLRAYLNC